MAAADFCRVEGIGERTAIALARTAALTGAPLRTLAALQARPPVRHNFSKHVAESP